MTVLRMKFAYIGNGGLLSIWLSARASAKYMKLFPEIIKPACHAEIFAFEAAGLTAFITRAGNTAGIGNSL